MDADLELPGLSQSTPYLKVDSNGVCRATPTPPIAAALSREGGFTTQVRTFLAWFNKRKPLMKKTAKTKVAAFPAEVQSFLDSVADTEAPLRRWTEPDRQEVVELEAALVGAVHGPKMVGEQATSSPNPFFGGTGQTGTL